MLNRTLLMALMLLGAATLASTAVMGDERSALEVVEKARDMWRGETFHATVRIEVTRGERTETQLVEAWNEGDHRSLVRILEPEEEAGNGYLLLEEDGEEKLWYYDHRAGEVISLPGLTLHEGFLGGGLDLDELMRGTVTDHYEVAFTDEQPEEGYNVELVPLPEAAVVYGKLVLSISEAFVITRIDYYDQRERVVKTAYTEDLLEVGERLIPRVWVVEEDTGDRTVATYKELTIDEPLPEDIFTLERLQQP